MLATFLVSMVNLANNDYLEIQDGMNKSSALVANFTTTETRLSNIFLKSTGRFLLVKFKSDSQYVGRGFTVHLVFEERPMSK